MSRPFSAAPLLRHRAPNLSTRVVGLAMLVFGAFPPTYGAPAVSNILFRVRTNILHQVEPEIFGQFLEKASFGEPGPESVVDAQTGRLPEEVMAKIREFSPPVLRFPGGSDVDRIDWTDMVDNVPGREGPRPVTRVRNNQIGNHFGYDEFLALADEVGSEALIVLNLAEGMEGRSPPEHAAQHAAGLVAYCNARVGTPLPEGMPNWPAVRAGNGHPEPYAVKYVQLGNEWFAGNFSRKVPGQTGESSVEDTAAWYLRVLHAYIQAIRAVDPQVKLIIDGRMGRDLERIVLADPVLRREVALVTFHLYAPGALSVCREGGALVEPATVPPEDVWYALSAIPGMLSNGLSQALGDEIRYARSLGYRIACTEWNWNGHGLGLFGDLPAHPAEIKAMGAAGFLHGLMRSGHAVTLATQSMFVGSKWDIATIRVDPEGAVPPFFQAQGMSTCFYRHHHGRDFHDTFTSLLPARPLNHVLGRWTKWPTTLPQVLAYTDLLATSDADRVYLHALHRHLDTPQSVTMDLADLGVEDVEALWHRLEVNPSPSAEHPEPLRIRTETLPVKAGKAEVLLPPRSISIIEVPRFRK